MGISIITAILAGIKQFEKIDIYKKTKGVKIGADWLFNNPNEWYKLSFDPVEV